MAEIISDGTRSVTSDDTSSRDYSRIFNGGGHSVDRDWPERTAERVRGQAHEDVQWASELGRDLNSSIERNGRSAELATEKVGAANVLVNEKTAAGNALASSLAFANTQNLLISGFKDGRFDAATNTAALQAALAECCCEVKELIREDGSKTRELIDEKEALRNAVELVDVKNQLTVAKSGEQVGLVNAIVNALTKGTVK